MLRNRNEKEGSSPPTAAHSVHCCGETAGIKQQETNGSIVGTSVAIRTENCQGGHSLTRLNEGKVQEGGRDSESSPFLVRLSCLSAQSERQAAGRHDQRSSTAWLSFGASDGKNTLNASFSMES